MKSIATINFKGGVGKTTITWLLAKYVADRVGKRVLVVDTDAQMSLTLAVQLREDGKLYGEFENWYKQHVKGKTLLDALDIYERSQTPFNFPIDDSFIYRMSDNDNLFFIPSTEELYWQELGVFDRQKAKNFVKDLLTKIRYSRHGKYSVDYVFFDCPPNFTILSYSVLNCCNLILIPVNPDVFASRGVEIMLDGLTAKIQPWPDPAIAVFMNKTRFYKNKPTKMAQQYWHATKQVCQSKKNLKIYPLDVFIPDRADIRDAIPSGRFPLKFEKEFRDLWSNLEQIIQGG